MSPERRRFTGALALLPITARAHEPTEKPDPEVERLNAAGESALDAGDPQRALDLFERAAALSHGAEAELGAARALMQMGRYANATALAAHIAGVHWRETGGTALYAWLLNVGGQGKAARALLRRPRSLLPDDVALRSIEALLEADDAIPAGILLERPGRLAPVPVGPQPGGRVVGTGVLSDGGMVVTALSNPAPGTNLWMRDFRGRAVALRPESAAADAPLMLWRPVIAVASASAVFAAAPRPPFPGAPWYALSHLAGALAEPAWPRMRLGFFGSPHPAAGTSALRLNATLPAGGEGSPLLDRQGRLTAIATRTAAGEWAAIPVTRLASDFATEPDGAERPASDALYERAFARCVQLIAA